MPPTNDPSAVKRNKSSQTVPQLAASAYSLRPRSNPRPHDGRATRSRKGSGTTTPTKAKAEWFEPKSPRTSVLSVSSEQRIDPQGPKSAEFEGHINFLKHADQIEDEKDEALPLSKKWSRDKKTEGKGSVNSVDGPILRPKPGRSPTFQGHWETNNAPPFSYAQAARTRSSRYQPRHSVQITPASEIARSPPSQFHGPPTPSPLTRQHRHSSLVLPEDSFEAPSSATPSVFDDDNEEAGICHSDLETDASSAPSSSLSQSRQWDTEGSERRITRPSEYFAELEDLEASVVGNSGLFLMSRRHRQAYPSGSNFRLRFQYSSSGVQDTDQMDRYPSYDDKVIDYCKGNLGEGLVSSGQSHSNLGQEIAYWAYHILECRNLMLSIVSNVNRMKAQDYCQDFYSLLTPDPFRKGVANLVKIPLYEISRLHQLFEKALNVVSSMIDSSRRRKSQELEDLRTQITSTSENLLRKCGLPPGTTSVGTWRRLIMTLDISIVSYCGTHQERFDLQYLSEDLNFATITPAWTCDVLASKRIMLRRRRLQCLNRMLQTEVWVFEDGSHWKENDALYLSTSLEVLSDVWGPSWAVKPSEDSPNAVEVQIGLGRLARWAVHQNVPELLEGEVFSHWIPHGEERPKRDLGNFSTDANLLIGAITEVEQTTSQLKESRDCKTRSNNVIRNIRQEHRLEEIGTSSDEKYLAHECVTAQFGYSGVTVGSQRVYKRRSGVTLKQAICESWKNNHSSRNPAILHHWLGVEVSFCSNNARRRRLKDILGSTTILHWLDSCKTSSDAMPCEQAFRDSLASKDPHAFYMLWSEHAEWRKDLGQLVSWCLEGLAHSKIDPDGNLHVLWMPRPDKRMLVKIKHDQHAWTGFLLDSRDHCSMAVMSRKCLYSDYRDASVCRSSCQETMQTGYSVLETALVINDKAPRPNSLELRSTGTGKKRQSSWNVSNVKHGEKLQVHAGRLTIREHVRKVRLLVEWERGVSKRFYDAKEKLTKSVGIESLYHWEFKEDDDSEPTKPIPLFVISQNM
ncbi:MAG: hypothetical protein M1831_000089 [Alyxoria varia]|nr:MAG: hypothetical protein M1831_000089 [Alyxoria varia]